MNIIQSICLFLLPSSFNRLIFKRSKNVKISPKAKIGFSFIRCNKLELGNNAKIGHLNFIKITGGVIMKSDTSIHHLNFIKGDFQIQLENGAWINNQNKISSISHSYHKIYLKLGEKAAIGVNHLLDMTDSISIGDYSMLAGAQTQIWTHSFFFSKNSSRFARLDASVSIGKHCYIGSRCCILSGVRIDDAITIGAQTCISKSLSKQGLYVSQGIRFLEFDPDKRMNEFGEPVDNTFIYNKDAEEHSSN